MRIFERSKTRIFVFQQSETDFPMAIIKISDKILLHARDKILTARKRPSERSGAVKK